MARDDRASRGSSHGCLGRPASARQVPRAGTAQQHARIRARIHLQSRRPDGSIGNGALLRLVTGTTPFACDSKPLDEKGLIANAAKSVIYKIIPRKIKEKPCQAPK